MILVLFLSIPAVQTRLGKYATKRVNDDFKTDINIGKVGLQFNGDVELKDILIKDHKQDTLFSIQELNTSIISINKLLNNTFTFGDIDVETLVFNLKTYEGEKDTNLDVFVAKFEDDNPRTGASTFLLSSSDISLQNSRFRLIDDNIDNSTILEFDGIQINATNFVIQGPEVRTRVNTLEFTDSSGVSVKNLATDFEYALDHMTFANMMIVTEKSELVGDLRFNYARKDLANFTNKVNIEARFKDSKIDITELNAFYDEFGTNQMAFLNTAEVSGTLNHLHINNLNLNTTRNTRIQGDIVLHNTFGKADGDFMLVGNYRNVSSNYKDLVALLPNILGNTIPSVFDNVGNFSMQGSSQITNETIDAKVDIRTDLGMVKSDLELSNINTIDDASYKGNLILEDFDMGSMLKDSLVGNTSLNLDIDGKSFKFEDINTNIIGKIAYLEYNNYPYTNIDVSGDFSKNIFNGLLKARDPNIDIDFNGLADLSKDIRKFDFKAHVRYANLNALNFVIRDSISEFKGKVDIAIVGSTVDNFEGRIDVQQTMYKNQDNRYKFKDFSVLSYFRNDNQRTVRVNSPDIAIGEATGKFKTKQILKLIQNAIGSIYTNYEPFDVEQGQYLDFDFTIYNQIASIIDRDLAIAPNTKVKGHIETNNEGFQLAFSSPKMSYKSYFADAIAIEIDNKNPVYNTFIEIDSIYSELYQVSKFSLINATKRDTLFIKSEFKGGANNADIYNMNLFYTIDTTNASVVGFRKSNLTFKGFNWLVNAAKDNLNKVVFDRALKNFDIRDVVLNQNEEEIRFSGKLRDTTYKNLSLDFKDVQLTKITPKIDSLVLDGSVNGKLALLQNNTSYVPTSTLEIDNFSVNAFNLGKLNAILKGDNSLTKYNVDVTLQNTDVAALAATGFVDVNVTNPIINVDVAFNDFLIDPLSPLGEGVISSIRGLLSGTANVSGSLKKPSIDGELFLDKAGLGIPYLNVDLGFGVDSRVTLKQQQFIFNNVELTDSKYLTKGFLNGFIEHHNFSNWQLGLDLTTDRLLVLDTQESEELYYGTAYVSGSADIDGYTDNLTIYVDGTSETGTVFNIPLSDAESFGDNSYIKFLSPEEKIARAQGVNFTQTEIKGLNLVFDLNINQNAEIEIVIDKDSGSTIKGNGEGNLGIFINTNGKFEMFGDFSVFEGVYKFKYGALVEKSLAVEPGGSIVWEGDPLEADVNLTALYTTTTNPSALLDAPINRSIPVNLEINLTDKLERPNLDFTFDFPNVDSAIKAELDYRLSSKEDRDNQGIFLLSSGSFFGGSLDFTGTISERVNGIINSIIGVDKGNFQVGVDLDLAQNNPNFETESRVGLTLQTKLSDKVFINGKLGVPFGSTTQTTIAGDVQIDWVLNNDGTLKATVFNRENPIQNFGDQIGFTQGLGIAYNVEFDTFKELLQTILKGKKKTKQKQSKDDTPTEETNFPEFISLKKKSSSQE